MSLACQHVLKRDGRSEAAQVVSLDKNNRETVHGDHDTTHIRRGEIISR